MNPNSAHQLWSKWTIRVAAPHSFKPQGLKENIARFIRKGFGNVGMCRISRPKSAEWLVEFLVESDKHPEDKPTFQYFARAFTEFFRNGFGPATEVDVQARIMAGEVGARSVPDQLLILPSFKLI